jgi:hypothetical protein
VRIVQWALTPVAWFTAALAALGVGAMIARRSLAPDVSAASVAALTAHGGLVFTALFAAGVSRLMVGLWPAVTTAAILGGWSVIHRILDSRR